MSQIKQTMESCKLGSEKGDCLSDCAKMMEEIQDMVNQKFNSTIDLLEQRFEDMNQKIMKLQEMMEKLLATTRINPENKIHDTKQRCLKLQFIGTISLPILTGEQIKAEAGDYMQVFLVDDCNGEVVDFGPEASAKVEIVALEGDSNWEGDTSTAGEVKSKIAGEREGKKSILAGNVQLKLNKGIASLSDVKFRSSARHNGGVFKLRAKAVDTFDSTRIIEAQTKPFQVGDYRRKYNQKHRLPSASDEVWRLKNIAKGGAIHERLKEEKVNSVEDFKILLSKDPEKLKHLLGFSEKKWKVTVTHAQTCPPDNNKYSSQENKAVVDAVGKAHAGVFVAFACEHEGVPSFGNEASGLQYTSYSSTAVELINSSSIENISGNHIEGSDVGKFDHTKFDAPFEKSLSSRDPEMDELDHTDINILYQDKLSSFNPTRFSAIRGSDFQSIDDVVMTTSNSSLQGLGFYPTSSDPLVIPDGDEYDFSDLLNELPSEECYNNHISNDTAALFSESQAVDRNRIWMTLFHISKWLSRRKRIASFERNQDQKRQRVCV